MSSALNRTTKAFHRSVNTPDYPVIDWIIDPDLSAVAGFASKYWIIVGDLVTLMDATARGVVDAADAAAILVAGRAEAITRSDLDFLTKAIVQAVLFEINKVNTRMQEVQDTFTAMKATATLATLRNAIPGPGTPTGAAPTAFANVNPQLRSQILQAIVDDINAGGADP